LRCGYGHISGESRRARSRKVKVNGAFIAFKYNDHLIGLNADVGGHDYCHYATPLIAAVNSMLPATDLVDDCSSHSGVAAQF
jgi:hypothetical protein